MNTNEECLLLFLRNPGRIDKTTSELILGLNTVSNPIKRENIINFEYFENKKYSQN